MKTKFGNLLKSAPPQLWNFWSYSFMGQKNRSIETWNIHQSETFPVNKARRNASLFLAMNKGSLIIFSSSYGKYFSREALLKISLPSSVENILLISKGNGGVAWMRNVPHRLTCLNIWTSASSAVVEPLVGGASPPLRSSTHLDSHRQFPHLCDQLSHALTTTLW